MYSEPELWHDLADRLARIAGAFLRMQVLAGASAVQLFDSWAGALPAADYEALVLPHVRTALGGVEDLSAAHGIPRVLFGVGTGELLGVMSRAGSEVMGVDFRVPLDAAAARVRPGAALQGNLDPAVVMARPEAVEARVEAVLAAARRSGRGHIFNLGHGVLPDTDPDVLTRIVAQVHAAGPAPAVHPDSDPGAW
jgi:uroporphyrinogen decarboxylase